MECQRCPVQPIRYAFTQANLENSLGRMKTKQIIAAVNNLKSKFNCICEACHSLPSQTNALVEELRKTWNEKWPSLAESIEKDSKDLLPEVEKLRQAFQVVCLTCSRVSNDDNPSNHGQTFVSLDSGYCQADSGRAKSTATDDNLVQSRADWIGMHRSPDFEEATYGMNPAENVELLESPETVEKKINETTSLLPPDIEDKLRAEFSNFVELEIIDKMLLSCIMSGMNVAEFAKMLWMPYSLVDPKTRKIKSVTKQAMHMRWKNICRRFPVFMSIAISSAKDDEKAMAKLKEFIDDPNGEENDNRFANGKMMSMYAKAAAKAKEQERKRREKVREEKERAEAKAERQKQKEKNRARKQNKILFPDNPKDCLPGLF